MAIAAWKRIEKSLGYQRMKASLRRLVGTELRLQIEITVETIKLAIIISVPRLHRRNPRAQQRGFFHDPKL